MRKLAIINVFVAAGIGIATGYLCRKYEEAEARSKALEGKVAALEKSQKEMPQWTQAGTTPWKWDDLTFNQSKTQTDIDTTNFYNEQICQWNTDEGVKK